MFFPQHTPNMTACRQLRSRHSASPQPTVHAMQAAAHTAAARSETREPAGGGRKLPTMATLTMAILTGGGCRPADQTCRPDHGYT